MNNLKIASGVNVLVNRRGEVSYKKGSVFVIPLPIRDRMYLPF